MSGLTQEQLFLLNGIFSGDFEPAFKYAQNVGPPDTEIYGREMINGARYVIAGVGDLVSSGDSFTNYGANNDNVGHRFTAENMENFPSTSTAQVTPEQVQLRINPHDSTIFWSGDVPGLGIFFTKDLDSVVDINGSGTKNLQTSFQPIHFNASSIENSTTLPTVLSGSDVKGFTIPTTGHYRVSFTVNVNAVSTSENNSCWFEVCFRRRNASNSGTNVLRSQGIWTPRSGTNPGDAGAQISASRVVNLSVSADTYQLEIKAQGNDILKLDSAAGQVNFFIEGPIVLGNTHKEG